MIREPAVCGSFYPSTQENIVSFIENSISARIQAQERKGIMLPHAGFIYSGKVAVETVSRTQPKPTLIILGPNHTGRGAPLSVFPDGEWKTPLGNINIDSTLTRQITENNLFKQNTTAHLSEHSIEVALPILQYFFNEFRFVAIACVTQNITVYKQAAQALFHSIHTAKKLKETLLIASSDMTHYEPQAKACKKDSYVLEAIAGLDTDALLRRVEEKNVSMCGVAPVAILLETLKLMNARKGTLIKYTTSGEITQDYNEVVGYAGMVFD